MGCRALVVVRRWGQRHDYLIGRGVPHVASLLWSVAKTLLPDMIYYEYRRVFPYVGPPHRVRVAEKSAT
jgi:hypothetical protein